jgi:type IV secretory pathway VirJ component
VNRCIVRCIAAVLFLCPLIGRSQDPTGVIRKDTREEVFDIERLGTIHALVPTQGIKSVAIFVDGDGGWNDGIADMAQLLANEGALVAGVDTVPYLKKIDADIGECTSVADDFATLARNFEERYGLSTYKPPVLVGYSSGATLVYAILAQAPQNIFRGAISLGFCSTLEIQHPLCRGRALQLERTKEGLEFHAAHALHEPWFVLQGTIDQACAIDEVSAFTKSIPTARLIALTKVGHGFAVARRWQPQYVAAYRELTMQRSK